MTAAGTLALWEALATTAPAVRGAAVLVARGAAPDLTTACELPLAMAAAAALAELRQRVGSELETVLVCPECGEAMDVPLPLDELARTVAAPDLIEVGDTVVRSPNTRDLMQALCGDDPAIELRERCISRPAEVEPDALAAQLVHAADQVLGMAGMSARVDCPGCGLGTNADIDFVALLSDQVAEQARGVLAEVADIASAFGWSEAAILELPEARRHAYLSLARRV